VISLLSLLKVDVDGARTLCVKGRTDTDRLAVELSDEAECNGVGVRAWRRCDGWLHTCRSIPAKWLQKGRMQRYTSYFMLAAGPKK
jgi:hypothetical protein